MASAHLLFNHISTTHTDLHRCAHETYTHVYGIHIQIRTCTHRYKHIHICPPHPPYIHTQLQGRWPSLGSAGSRRARDPSGLPLVQSPPSRTREAGETAGVKGCHGELGSVPP